MAFSYSINTGNQLYGDTAYLKNRFGFSTGAISGVNSGKPDLFGSFVQEYAAIFNSTLAVSDAYKFFETNNTQQMQSIWSGSTITYSADHPLTRSVTEATSGGQQWDYITTKDSKEALFVADRISVYKERFLENFKPSAASADITITNGSAFALNGYTFNELDANGNPTGPSKTIASAADVSSLNHSQLVGLGAKLEKEANLLEKQLVQNELAYGGYPVIGYNAAEAKIELLKQQMDVAMQEFIKIEDQLFGYYKLKAGAHSTDNGAGAEVGIREQEAASAAAMNAKLAIDYAEKYYSQDVKPTAKDYVFGEAPIVFSSLAADNTRKGFDKSGQSSIMNNALSAYMSGGGTGQLTHLFDGKGGTYDVNNVAVENLGGTYEKIYYSMNTPGTLIKEPGVDKGSEFSPDGDTNQAYLNEVGSNVNDYIQWMIRDSYAVGGVTANVRNTDYTSETASYLSNDIIKAAEKLVNIKMQIEKLDIETSINNKLRAEYESRMGALQALESINYCMTGTDPYEVNIDGQKYILGQDSNQDGTINEMGEILGINDSQDNLFESMKKLDTDNDGYVSQEELQANKIVLGAVDANGKFTGSGYDMSLVKGINLASLQNADGTNNIFGKFSMDLQDKQAEGKLTFEDSNYFKNLFSGIEIDNIDEDSSVAPIAIPTSKATTTTTEATTENAVEETTPTETNSAADLTTTQDFSFNFTSADDNKSTIEKLIDQLCWKLGITNITSTQKYSIIDGIDPNTEINIMQTEIQNDLEKFTLSA